MWCKKDSKTWTWNKFVDKKKSKSEAQSKEFICGLYDGANTKAEVKRNVTMRKIGNFVLEILL